MRTTTRLLTGLLSLPLLLGCKKQETETPTGPVVAPAKKVTVCLLPKKKGLPYFSSCAEGARQAAELLGNVELIYDGPTDGSRT